MTYVDKQGRIILSQDVREVTTLDFEKEIRIFCKTKHDTHYLILSNDDLNYPCFGIAKMDEKFRFCIPKDLRKYLELESDSAFLIYTIKGQLIIKML